MSVCRAVVAFFISPAAAIECHCHRNILQERARYMRIWTLMVTIGVPLSPHLRLRCIPRRLSMDLLDPSDGK